VFPNTTFASEIAPSKCPHAAIKSLHVNLITTSSSIGRPNYNPTSSKSLIAFKILMAILSLKKSWKAKQKALTMQIGD